MKPLPEKTYEPGWPEYILDVNHQQYVLLRDGSGTEFGGNACLYGLTQQGQLFRDHLYTPTLGATRGNVYMSGGTWMDPEEMVKAGVPPIVIPDRYK